MIHLPTAAGGRIEHVMRLGQVAPRGELLLRVHAEDGPVEEIVAPYDALVAFQRLHGKIAPRYAHVVGLRRVVIATCPGRVRWIAMLGPVSTATIIALLDHQGAVRPHRAGGSGFVGERFVSPGVTVEAGAPLIEIRGEELG